MTSWNDLKDLIGKVFEEEKRYITSDEALMAVAEEVDNELSDDDIFSLIGSIRKAHLDAETIDDIVYDIRKSIVNHIIQEEIRERLRPTDMDYYM